MKHGSRASAHSRPPAAAGPRARELAPHAERIIITGYTDSQDIIAAINEGHAYRYILKPWTEEDLQVTITPCGGTTPSQAT